LSKAKKKVKKIVQETNKDAIKEVKLAMSELGISLKDLEKYQKSLH